MKTAGRRRSEISKTEGERKQDVGRQTAFRYTAGEKRPTGVSKTGGTKKSILDCRRALFKIDKDDD